MPSLIAPIVIGGCGSSGTTLLRQMLDRHPEIYCGPESTLFLTRTTSDADLAERFGFAEAQVRLWRTESRSKVEFIERFQAACLARSGKSVWAEKTPENIRQFPAIARRFPRARLVHVIRDGRDVACSLRRAEWMKLEKITGGAPRNSPEVLETCIRYWAERVAFGRSLAGSSRYHEIRYEDLVADPERTLRGLLAFAGLAWDPRMLQADEASPTRDGRPIYGGSAGRWRRELSAGEAEIVARHAGLLLADLGYETARDWGQLLPQAPPAPRSAAEPTAPAPAGLRSRLKVLRCDALALGLALQDGRTPLAARLVGAFAVLYGVSPVDIIPDNQPIGYLDDIVVAAIAVPIIAKLLPAALRAHHRRRAAILLSRKVWAVGSPRARLAEALRARAGWLGKPLVGAWTRLCAMLAGPSYVVDAELRFVSVNPAALRVWGKGPDEVLGRRMLEVFPGVAAESYRAHLEALRTLRAQRVTTHSRLYGRPLQVAIRPMSEGLRVQFAMAA
jgi:PAS domain S-box-containing protein